jgi:hypothetical protein
LIRFVGALIQISGASSEDPATFWTRILANNGRIYADLKASFDYAVTGQVMGRSHTRRLSRGCDEGFERIRFRIRDNPRSKCCGVIYANRRQTITRRRGYPS